jgi:valyl-tRNA synthetase
MPEHKKYDRKTVERFETVKEIISSIRSARKEKNIPMKELIGLYIRAGKEYDSYFNPVIKKLGNLSDISFTDKKISGAASFHSGTVEYYIPMGHLMDVEGEIEKAMEELKYAKGFLSSVMTKLNNERFVQNAPASIIENERKKKSDAEIRIRSLEEKIRELKK